MIKVVIYITIYFYHAFSKKAVSVILNRQIDEPHKNSKMVYAEFG